jgi:hypothetical protein
MASGFVKIMVALLMIGLALFLDFTAPESPLQILQLLISFALAIGGALVGIRGLLEFLSDRFQ